MSQPPSLPALPPRYKELAYVSEGAFGHVYRAVDADGRVLAVKVLSPDWLGDADVVWRFTGEYRRLAALAHPAFPRAVEEGLTGDGRPYFAMSFLAGRPLDRLAPLPADRVTTTLAKVAEALAHLHGLGLVHGDLKAANVLLDDEGGVALLDVGSAAPIGQRREAVEGTPEYMAPEVLRQVDVAPEADWYALGVLGYELLSGHVPFQPGPDGASSLVRAQLFDAPPALDPAVEAASPRLAAGVMALLEKDPARRAAHLGEVFSTLGLPAPAEPGLRGGTWVPQPVVEAAWERLSFMDGGEVLAIAGPAGSGKSRALDALRLEARLQGRVWVAASCGGAGEAPGSVARVMLRQALAIAQLPASENVATWLAGGLPADWLDLEPRARKLSLFGALAEAWASAAGVLNSVIVGLDDWHLADALSREIVEHIRQAPAGRRTYWCLAGEPGAPWPQAEVLELPAWSELDVKTLVESRLGGEMPENLAGLLAAVGADRPGPINALLEYWAASGALKRERGTWRFAQSGTTRELDPFARLWQKRLARLGEQALRLARVAGLTSSAGPLPAATFGRALELEDAALQTGLDELLATGILARAAGGLRLAVPSHADELAEAIPETERRALATRIARLVLDRDPFRAGAPEGLDALPLPTLVAAARLAVKGEDDELAVALAGIAAKRSLEHFALDDAWEILAGARDRLTDAVPPAQRLGLFLVGADAARLSDRIDEAVADFEQALMLAKGLKDEGNAAIAYFGLAKLRQLRGKYPEALELANQALAAAERAGLPAMASRAALMRARVEFYTTGQAAARVSCARAVALAAAGNAPAMRSAALTLQGVLVVQEEPGAKDEALGMIREAIAISEGLGDLVGVAAALENLGNAYVTLGELREARDAFARDADHCRAHGISTEGLSADMNLARTLAELGEVDAAATLADDVEARAAALGRTYLRSVARAAAGTAAWRGARVEASKAALDEALELVQSIKNRYAEAYFRLDRLEAQLATGDLVAARPEAEAAAALGTELALPDVSDRLAVMRAELAHEDGDHDAAVALATPFATGTNRFLALSAHFVLGRVALAGQHHQQARKHFEAAAGIARSWNAPWFLAAARFGLAKASVDADEAIAHAREALAPGPNPFARAGAAWVLARHNAMDNPARQALDDLALSLAGLSDDDRERVLEAQGLPDDATLTELRGRAISAASGGMAGLGDLAAWHQAILDAKDEATVHQTLVSGLVALARADRGYLLGYERGRLLEVVTLGVDYEEEVAQGFSSSIAEEALFTGEPIYLVDAGRDDRWREAQSVQALGLRTVIALPYATRGQLLGVVYMDRAAIEPILAPDDLSGLSLLAGSAAVRVAGLRREGDLLAELAFERQVSAAAIAVTRESGTDPRGSLLDAALAITGAQRGYWLARDDEGRWDALATRAAREAAPVYQPNQISQSVLGQATEEREAVCLIETDRPESWTPGQSILALGIRMVWCVPLGPDAREAVYIDTSKLDAVDPRTLLDRLESLLSRFLDALPAPRR